jgi:hypothetical protein
MSEIIVEQAIYWRDDGAAPRLMGRSSGFRDEWLEEAAGLVVGFGERPPGVRCAAAVFAHPLGQDQVAIVQVADRIASDSGRPASAFHISALPQMAYEGFSGDPFGLARRLPPEWENKNPEARRLAAEPLPPRRVADIQRVLKRIKAGALREDQDPDEEPERTPDNSESPALLGAVQILVDGGRVVFERPEADSGLIPDLWTLLPKSTRCRLWPASYAFGNALHFDALVVPRMLSDEYEGYTREDQAAEYPAGHYEYNLQVAAEHDDQQALDALLNRRSWAQTWRLGVTLLVLVIVLAIAGRVLEMTGPTRPPAGQEKKVENKDKK